MAKGNKEYEDRHRRNIERQSGKVSRSFDELAGEVARVGWSARNKPDPLAYARKDIGKIVATSLKGLEVSVGSAIEVEWKLSNRKNDDMVKDVLPNSSVETLRLLLEHNQSAMEAFKERAIGGLNLSDRIWRLEKPLREEVEASLAIGLKDGTSAAQVSRDIRQYMRNPDKLFRRVRDDKGVLRPSSNARAFHPGQGVYRSSRANALRLARTEINMSYRTADSIRWEDMEFVKGYEVKRSANPYPCPICEALKGGYPKEFVFLGWHPNCRCYTVPILDDVSDFVESELIRLEGRGSGKRDQLKMPLNFINYLQENYESIMRSAERGSEPYFISINKDYLLKYGILS